MNVQHEVVAVFLQKKIKWGFLNVLICTANWGNLMNNVQLNNLMQLMAEF